MRARSWAPRSLVLSAMVKSQVLIGTLRVAFLVPVCQRVGTAPGGGAAYTLLGHMLCARRDRGNREAFDRGMILHSNNNRSPAGKQSDRSPRLLLLWNLGLDELRKQPERVLPAEIAGLGGNEARYAFLHDVQLGPDLDLLQGHR